jgi:3-phosphoshikimate 1-carboxyvinyltransferase
LPKTKLKLNTSIQIKRTSVLKGEASLLPASKSISNRALIINALAGGKSDLHNLSDANDTQLMLRLVTSKDRVIDVEDAGTTMRFLTAYFAVTNQEKILTGTARMKERPIGILVDALKSLGCDIAYLEKEGFPPHEIKGFSGQKTDTIRIRGDVSSQYISALMMVAPVLPKGLKLILEGKVGSRPYIDMTAALMKHFGVDPNVFADHMVIGHQDYKPKSFTVESDWSAASYWFAFTALAEDAEIVLPKLLDNSLQGDSAILKIMEQMGVKAQFQDGSLKLSKIESQREISWDFTHCPDLAQTVTAVCASKNIKGYFTGLESLRIKETDRISALQNELKKIGAELVEESHTWTLNPSPSLPATASFATYKDHRMAMAFAPLATLMDIEIEAPDVVRKSYPNFWNDMKTMGFIIQSSANVLK